jgi:C-terminal processing protease CtpA/Prc
VEADAEGEPDARIASLILDSIFLNFKDLKGLIVDVRDNVGGNDQFSYELASRFAVKKTLGTSVRTRIRGGKYEQLGPAVKTYIAPKEQLNFHGPVVVLTNDKTVSAGDVFAVLMTELPKTTIIGSNTRGIYSDMYGFTLPNGWQVSLSNQRYYNNEGICFEGSGTPVDVKVMNTKADLSSGVDPVLRRAFKELSK